MRNPLRAVLIDPHFFLHIFLFFFQQKQEKQEEQETFPKFGNLTEGAKYLERFAFQYLGGEKWKIWKCKKMREKKMWKFRPKSISIRTAHTAKKSVLVI